MYYAYILKSKKSGKYYVGQTEDVEKRLDLHNAGKVVSTKLEIPWEVFYKESFDDRALAVKRERQIKAWKSRDAIERLESSNKIEDPRFSIGKSGQ